jgi:hypothetical protein
MVFLPVILAAATVASDPVQTFVQRVTLASSNHVTIGALPSSWTSPVPLPSAIPVLGSIERVSSIDIFYQPPDSAPSYAAYSAQLQHDGFTLMPQSGLGSGSGFAQESSVPSYTLFCRGEQAVTVTVPPDTTDDLRVSVSSAAQPGGFGPCKRPTEGFSPTANPLPLFVVPSGVAILPDSWGGGTSFAYGPSGASSRTSFGASLRGNTSVARLLAAFGSQLTQAGWRVGTSSSGQAGVAYAVRDFGGSTWNATLVVYADDAKPHTFHAVTVASGAPMTKPMPEPRLPSIPQSLTKSDTPLLLQLMQRMLDANADQRAAVLPKGLPPDLPSGVPLPQGELLGSMVVAPLAPDAENAGYDTLYYDMTQSQLSAYHDLLERDGWQGQSPIWPAVGFVSAASSEPIEYCKQHQPSIAVRVRPQSNAVTIDIARNIPFQCHTMTSQVPRPESESLLPRLVAPSQVVNRWTTDGSGHASFQSTLTPAALLDIFQSQMTDQHWSASTRLIDLTVGTQTFTKTDSNGHQTQAALTIYRTNAQASGYAAVIDVTGEADP